MRDNLGLLGSNVRLLKSRASHHAYAGVLIAFAAVLVATLLTCWYQTRGISLDGLFSAQASNPGLWLLDAMPFVFALWGQYVSVLMAHDAGAMVMDQTEDLRSDKLALEAQLRTRGNLDRLTGLATRELFVDRCEQAIQQAYGSGTRVGVVLLDLNDFSEINQTLGPHNGDRVLQSISKRLGGAFSEPTTVARLGSDSFAVLLPRFDDVALLDDAAHRITRALELPFALENVNLSVQASIGAAMVPDDAADADTLINLAEQAMRHAKSSAVSFKRFSSIDQKSHDPRRLSMVAELRVAMTHQQLELHVQPIVSACDGTVTAAEALLRWPHPTQGLISPTVFIPRAERSGMINELTRWVLERALDLTAQVIAAQRPMQMAVNLSARSLLDPDFPDMLAGLLAARNLPGLVLTLEITEDTLMSDHASLHHSIGKIAGMGVRFAIDDFGTGYSQLAYLKRLPVSELKIDKSFIADMLTSSVDASIVEATINLAHVLDLRVVAEGVETAAQVERLRALNCDLLQGFHYAQAMPPQDFLPWLQARDHT